MNRKRKKKRKERQETNEMPAFYRPVFKEFWGECARKAFTGLEQTLAKFRGLPAGERRKKTRRFLGGCCTKERRGNAQKPEHKATTGPTGRRR